MALLLRVRRTNFVMPGGEPETDEAGKVAQQNVLTTDGVDVATHSLTLDTVNKKVLESRDDRKYFELQNPSALPMYVNVDGSADVGVGFEIAAGGSWSPQKAPIGSIHCRGSTANQDIVIMEGF